MSWINLDKLNEALEHLEKFSIDPLRKRSIGAKRFHRRRRQREAKKRLEKPRQEKPQTRIIDENMRGVHVVPCVRCGVPFECDVDSVVYLSKVFGVNPDEFVICGECRNKRGVKTKLKREIRKQGANLI